MVDSDRIVFTEAALAAYIERVNKARAHAAREIAEAQDEVVESKVKAKKEAKADKTTESYEADHAKKEAKTAKAEAAKKAKEDDK